MQQGQRSSVGTLPENISFGQGSTSSNAVIDSQRSWNSMQGSAQNRLPDYGLLPSETNIQHLQHDTQNTEWGLGESSSNAAETFHPQGAQPSEERQCGSSNYFSLDNVNVNANANVNRTTNGSFLLLNSSPVLSHDLNMSSGSGDQEDNGRLVGQRPNTSVTVGSSNRIQAASSSSSSSLGGPSRYGGSGADNSEDRPGYSLDGRRTTCKRKALELNVGQSSGVGGSNCFQNEERIQWNATVPFSQIAVSNTNMTAATENDISFNNRLERANSRLRLGVGDVSANPFSLTTPPGNVESSRRNVRMQINSLHEQGLIANNPLPTEAGVGNAGTSPSRHSSRLALRDRFFDMNPSPAVESEDLAGHSDLLHSHSVHQNHQSGWSGISTVRPGSSPTLSIPREWNTSPYVEPTSSRNIPRIISEHRMFAPPNGIGSSLQNPMNWNLVGGNNNNAGNVASSSQIGPDTGTSYPASNWSRRGCPQYPRRLSELVRRSWLSSTGAEFGGHVIQSSSTSQEAAHPPEPDNHRHRAPHSRSALLERHLDGAFGIPYSLRTLAAAREGRNSVMSEIRRVLDLMQRGEALRLEDVMILDHSVLFGMADIHDRHRDMRLDVDNMSYEELLELEERIGNVCTGLNEETIMSCLKQHKYVTSKLDQEGTEPCCICREEYSGGEDIVTLECGHNFHRDCIKQWLLQKNLCPICKATGLTT